MRSVGRVLRFAPLCFAVILAGHSIRAEHGVPIEIKIWDTGRTPLNHMVDVTNQFGLKVLAEHNFLNENNIAFSPYGLIGIMVALFEGVEGESSYQIQRGMQLPRNRNVMRVGFRDIHRTLKTYFVPEEGFLAGLALNNENVTFNDSYKKILRFYGFDLERERPTPSPPLTNTTSSSPSTTTSAPPAEPTTSVTPAQETPAREDPDIKDIEETTVTPTTTVAPSDIEIRVPTETPQPPETTSAPETTVTTMQPMTAAQESETTVDMQTAVMESSPTDASTTQTEEPSTPDTGMNSSPPEVSEIAALTAAESTMTTVEVQTETTPSDSSTTEETISSTDETTTSDVTTETTTPMAAEEELEMLRRKKRSLVDFLYTSPPYVDDYLIYKSLDIPPDVLRPSVDTRDKMFLVNGLRNVQVTYMRYDTILEHAYLPHLEASAVRLPLDSERYYLLVILPSRTGPADLGQLIARMARESDLRDVHSALRPRRVKALVPSFTVKGHVTLTTDLQKLGLRDVFEPRQRDFGPMTAQPGVYVRSIEQAVSVAIRKYREDDHHNRFVASHQQVHFLATYPFIYFVMDSNIHVSLMAGKMVDPLNTRIL